MRIGGATFTKRELLESLLGGFILALALGAAVVILVAVYG